LTNGLYTDADVNANGLQQYTGTGTAILFDNGALGNAGEAADNRFSIYWECGTLGAGNSPMNAQSILDQNLDPDRYTTNVILDLSRN
jgi:hypothetical protein